MDFHEFPMVFGKSGKYNGAGPLDMREHSRIHISGTVDIHEMRARLVVLSVLPQALTVLQRLHRRLDLCTFVAGAITYSSDARGLDSPTTSLFLISVI